jgi:hypothetical protein
MSTVGLLLGLDRLRSLNMSEYRNPGLGLRQLTGERGCTCILPDHRCCGGPMHRGDVAGERLFCHFVRQDVVNDGV